MNAEQYFNQGNEKRDQKDFEGAIRDYDKAIEINPQYAYAYNNRGLSKNNLGQYQEAIKDYDKAIEINPQYAMAYNNRGVSKQNLGQYQDAIKDLDKAIEINPQYAKAYNNRGNSKHNLGQYQEAIKDCDKAIEINPQDADAYNNRGNSKHNLGQYQEAIKDYQEALKINPSYKLAKNNLETAKKKLEEMPPKQTPPLNYKKVPSSELTVHGELGSGSYGTVYRARWQHAEYAYKALHLNKLNEDTLTSFRREVQILSQLDHPNVVHFFGACEEPGHYGVLMHYAPKGNLTDVLAAEHRTLSWQQRYKMAYGAAAGLTYLHTQQKSKPRILHRDLKSPNILVNSDYSVVITDFGLSKIKNETASKSKITQSNGGPTGSIRWKEPERCQKRGLAVSAESDVYALGMVLWEIASGKLPFSTFYTDADILIEIFRGEHEIMPDNTPPQYANIIKRCWQERSTRPSAEAITNSLQKLIDDDTPEPPPIAGMTLSDRPGLMS